MFSDWKYSIESAVYIFPVIAMIITMPFLIHNFRKYGSVPVSRFLCIYLFIFYLLTAYFLVILPLPTRAEAANLTTPVINLNITRNILELEQIGELLPQGTHGWMNLIRKWDGIEPFFNILLTIPFGFFLHYYYRKGILSTAAFTFLLSVFFELTQLSGLYGIYPRPYRLCDINDVITNTAGGLIGWCIAPLFGLFLPSREEIDEAAYENAVPNSYTRRLTALIIDKAAAFGGIALIAFFTGRASNETGIGKSGIKSAVLKILKSLLMDSERGSLTGTAKDLLAQNAGNSVILGLESGLVKQILLVTVILILTEWVSGGRSVGKSLVGIRLARRKDTGRPGLGPLLLRGVIVHGILTGLAIIPSRLVYSGTMLFGTQIPARTVLYILTGVIYVFLISDMIMEARFGERVLLYEKLTGISNFEVEEIREKHYNKSSIPEGEEDGETDPVGRRTVL